MKRSLLMFAGLAFFALTAPMLSQFSATTRIPVLGPIPSNSSERSPEAPAREVQSPPSPISASVSAYSPLQLRGGAVPTKLWGFYDYQSNGKIPYWLWVDPTNPLNIHATYMLSTDSTAFSASRRVGYSYSKDGGATWTAMMDIGQGRLGFPHIQVASGNIPMIAAHGLLNTSQLHTMLLVGDGPFSSAFVPVDLPQPTASGRTDGDPVANGVIWPTYVFSKDQKKAIISSSYSNPSGTGQAPQQVCVLDLNSAQVIGNKWNNLADSSMGSSSGGRNVMASSTNGKIGIAYYHFSDTGDVPVKAGLFFTESTNEGATWSTPQRVWGNEINSQFNENGDQDTTTSGYLMDMMYVGEEPHIVFKGELNFLYRYESIFHWSPSKGVEQIAGVNPGKGIGCVTLPRVKAQSNMSPICYPSISSTSDGQHMVVTFGAVASTSDTGNVQVADDNGFIYYRTWAVGTSNGGTVWGDPFIVQDFGGSGSDSASIEYSFSDKSGKMNGSNYEFSLAFQARRHPGMFANVSTNSDTGIINACYQYYQKMVVTPDMFRSSSPVRDRDKQMERSLTLTSYPNPAGSAAALEFTVPTAGTVSLSLYNALGQEVLSAIRDEHVAAGSFSKIVQLGSLPAGNYRCVLTHNGVRTTSSLSVVH